MKQLLKRIGCIFLSIIIAIQPSVTVIAAEYPLSSVSTTKLIDDTISLNYGKSKTIKIDKGRFPTRISPIWTSADYSIATVNSKGKVKGVGRGITTVSARINDDIYTCKVIVDHPELIEKKIVIAAGESRKVALIGVLSVDNPQWILKQGKKSSQRNIISVSGNTVTGLRKGHAKIHTYINNKKYTVSVVVTNSIAPLHEHKYEAIQLFDPTPSTPGEKLYRCACGSKYTEKEAYHHHTPAAAVIENLKEPLCDEYGSYDEVVYCSGCGEELSRTTIYNDALGHDYQVEEVVEPTCTEAGHTVYICSRCGKEIIDDPTECTGHHMVLAEHKESSCTESGIDHYVCVNCGITSDIAVSTKGHRATVSDDDVPEYTVDIEPTCTTKGQRSVHCVDCGASIPDTIEEIPALGHKDPEEWEVNEAGTYRKKECLRCGRLIDEQYYLSLDWDQGVENVDGEGWYSPGDVVNTHAELKYGYEFSKWSGFVSSGMNNLSFAMPSRPISVYANTTQNMLSATASGYVGEYDGQPHAIDVRPSELSTLIEYSDSEDGTYSPEKIYYTDAGVYKTYYKVSKNNYKDYYGSAVVIIEKANGKASVTINDGKYGEELLPPLATSLTNDTTPTFFYKERDASSINYSTEMPTEAGKYTVKAVFPGNANYNQAEATANFVITKAKGELILGYDSINIGFPGSAIVTISGNAASRELSVSSTYEDVATAVATSDGIHIMSGKTSGTTTVTVKSIESNNYTKAEAKIIVNVLDGEMEIESSGYEREYDEDYHGINLVLPSGATAQYSADGGNTWSFTPPMYKLPGTYTVDYKVSRTGYADFIGQETVKITPASFVVNTEPYTTLYDGLGHSINLVPSISGTKIYYAYFENNTTITKAEDVPEDAWTIERPAFTNLGTYKIYYKATKLGYSDVLGASTVTIEPNIINVSSSNYLGAYDGMWHSINVEADGNYDVKYSDTQNGVYTSNKPQYIYPGTYTVYFQISRLGYSTIRDSRKVVISKLSGVAGSLEMESAIYTGAPISSDPVITEPTGEVTYTYSGHKFSPDDEGDITSKTATGEEYGTTAEEEKIKPTDAGVYTVTAHISANEIFNAATLTKQFVIGKADGYINGFEIGDSTYNGSATDSTPVYADASGEVSYLYTGRTFAATDAGASVDEAPMGSPYVRTPIKPSNAGVYTVKATSAATVNHKKATASATFIIKKAGNTFTLNTHSLNINYPSKSDITIEENASNGRVTVYSDNPDVATAIVSDLDTISVSAVNIGNTSLNIKSDATTNYLEFNDIVEISVIKGGQVVSSSGWTGPYDGQSHGITVNADGGAITYSTDGTTYRTLNYMYTTPGSHKVYYKVVRDNFNDVSGFEYVNISYADISVHAVGYTGSWDGSEHYITVNSSIPNVTVKYAYAKYGISDPEPAMPTSEYSENVPTIKDVGRMKVWYEVSKDYHNTETGSRIVTINPSSFAVVAEGYEGFYDGNSHSINVTASVPGTSVAYAYRTDSDPATVPDDSEYTYMKPLFNEIGDYTVYYRASKAGYDDIYGSATVKIKYRDSDVLAQSYTGAYDENPHSIKVKAPSGYKVTYSTEENGTYTQTNPEYTLPGGYTTWYKVYTNRGAFVTSGSKSVTISKLAGYINGLNIQNTTYTGAMITINPSYTEISGPVTYKYKGTEFAANDPGHSNSTTATGAVYPESVTKPVNAGVYTVTAYVAETDTHEATSSEKTFVIAKADGYIRNLSMANTAYTGSAIASIPSCDASGIVTYSYSGRLFAPSDEGGEGAITATGVDYSSSSTKPANAGIYKVKAKADASSNYLSTEEEAEFIITKKENDLTLNASSLGLVYPASGSFEITSNPSGGSITVDSSNPTKATATRDNNKVTVRSHGEGNVDILVTSAATSNYKSTTKKIGISITKGSIDATVNGYEGVYDGKPHSITVAASGYDISYSLDDSTYRSAGYQFTDVGTNTVYYKIEKEGYEPIIGSEIVKITPATLNVSASGVNHSWDGTGHSITVECTTTGAKIEYAYATYGSSDPDPSSPTSSYSTDNPTLSNVGKMKVWYKVTKSNYTTVEGYRIITITPANTTIHTASSSTSGELVYPAFLTLSILNYNGNGQISAKSSDREVATVSATANPANQPNNYQYDLLKVASNTKEGSADIDIEASQTAECNAASAQYTVYVSKGNLDVDNTSHGSYTGEYDGLAHSVYVTCTKDTAGNNVSPTIKYGIRKGEYTTTEKPSFTEAGKYTRFYQVSLAGYNTVTGIVTAEIRKESPTYSVLPGAKTLTYNTTSQELVTAGETSDGTFMYAIGSSDTIEPTTGWSATVPTKLHAGTYYVWYKIQGDENHSDIDPACLTSKILPKNLSTVDIALASYSYTYDGKEKAPIVTVKDGTKTLSGRGNDYVVAYNNNIEVGQAAAIITGCNDYTGERTVNFNINNANIASKYLQIHNGYAQYDTLSHDGGAYVNVTDPNISSYSIKYGESEGGITSGSIPVFTNVDTYTVYFRIQAPNYNDYTGHFTIQIDKGSGNITTQPSDLLLSYNGEPQTLVGTGDGTGTIMYRLGDSGDFSTTIPKATDAGAYTIYYYAAESTNYYQSAINSIDISIDKAPGAVSATVTDKAYDGIKISSSHSSSTNDRGYSIQFEGNEYSASDEGTATSPNATGAPYVSVSAPTNAGAYTMTVTYAECENYKESAKTVSFHIYKAEGNGSVSMTGWTYGSTPNLPVPVSTTNGTGAVSYTYYNSSHSVMSSGVSSSTDAGTYYVKAQFTSTINYKSCYSDETSFTISRAPGSGYVSISDWVQGEAASEPVSGTSTNGAVTYKYYNSSYTQISKPGSSSAKGTYYITATFAQTTNYNAYTTDYIKFMIK